MKLLQKPKVVLISTLFLFALATIVNTVRYPELPIDAVSPKEALAMIKKSDQDMAKLSKESNATWYIAKSENGISAVDETVKKMISNKGWVFKQKDGSGLFFERNDESLIVTTEVWKNYYLIRVPVHT